MKLLASPVLLALACGACAVGQGDVDDDVGQVEVAIHAGPIPEDAACAHIVATRLSDFKVSEYTGPLDGAVLSARSGEHRVVGNAYPAPCQPVPGSPAWTATEQLATFAAGSNMLILKLNKKVDVTIDPEFVNDEPTPLVLRDGSRVRTGRNGEDATGPSFSLDGWELKQIAVPAPGGGGPGDETVVFTTQGKGGADALPYSPRGVARTDEGNFLFQVGEPFQSLRLFDPAGSFLAAWPTIYPTGRVIWDFTDGLEGEEPGRFVRTGWLNTPQCDDAGENCVQSGLDILERKTAVDGSTYLEVVTRILLPEPYNETFAVGVAYLGGGRYALSLLPDEGGTSMLLLGADGTVLNSPPHVNGSFEGLFLTGDGRLGGLDYEGIFQAFDLGDLAPRVDEMTFFREGVDVSNISRMVWSDDVGQFIVLDPGDHDHRLFFASDDFSTISADFAIDLSRYFNVTSLDWRPETHEVLLADRLPPIIDGVRTPQVDFFDVGSPAPSSSVALKDVPRPVRLFSMAYAPAGSQIITHYRRPGNPPDPIDSQVFVHDLAGNLVATFDLQAKAGVQRIRSVHVLRATNELMFVVGDNLGTTRLLVTDRSGNPRRSYRVDAISDFADVAPIVTGAHAGDLGVFGGQPSFYQRAFAP